jgi:hypothetical protein
MDRGDLQKFITYYIEESRRIDYKQELKLDSPSECRRING